jgi:hypothetical protein
MGGAFLKAKKLLIPQITLSFTIIVLKGTLWVFEGNSLAGFDFRECFAFWFLPVLFLCSLYYMIVSVIINLTKKHNRIIVASLSLMLAILAILVPFDDVIAPVDWLAKSAVAMPFYFCGSFFKERVLKIDAQLKIVDNIFLILLLPTIVILSQINTPVRMYENEYGIMPLFLLTSVMGIILVVEISKRLVNMPILIEFGKLSIAVYVWNFLIVGFTLRIINRIMLMMGLSNDTVLTTATFSVSLIILYLLSKWTYNKLPYLYGLKKTYI